jgi:two-component system, oxyanion-binding sensor
MPAETSNKTSSQPEIHAGFIPLTDCAPLVIAKELGFDQAQGFSLILHRDVSWANIRDKMEADLLDCAIMLAPMPLAATLGLGGRSATPMIAAMATSLNGNAITVSRAIYSAMCAVDPESTAAGGMAPARSLAKVVAQRQQNEHEPLTLGIVHPFSCHNYDLRYWLAAAGIDPDHDVNLVVVPPPLIAGSLKSGRIDGFCVGEPWNSVAAAESDGVIVATKSELWAASPEKVLGLKLTFAEKNKDLTLKLIRALTLAGAWLDDGKNRARAAELLSMPHYVGTSQAMLAYALSGALNRGAGMTPRSDPETILFSTRDANFPWISHAAWILTQMIRWGQVRSPFDIMEIANSVYRPDLYRAAVAGLGTAAPAFDMKKEGGDQFFGGDQFDANAPVAYLRRLARHDSQRDFAEFGRDPD